MNALPPHDMQFTSFSGLLGVSSTSELTGAG
jgi:hypothetical protein